MRFLSFFPIKAMLFVALLMMVQLAYSGDTALIHGRMQSYTKVLDGYRYELTFNPEDVIIPENKGSYAKRIRVYKEPEMAFFYEYVVHGDFLTETPQQRDSFELMYINFDVIPDIRFSHARGYHTYLVSYKNNGKNTFYSEIWLNRIHDFTRDTVLKELVGEFTMHHMEYVHTFQGTYLDTLTIFSQTLHPVIRTQELRYHNVMGSINIIHDPVIRTPPIRRKKETGDYNFDGCDDLRIRDTTGLWLWSYYLYDSVTNTLVCDSLLSSMRETYFEGGKDKFYGRVVAWSDEVHETTDTYTYLDGKLTLTARNICLFKSPVSERRDCEVYKLLNGKLEYIETIPGIE